MNILMFKGDIMKPITYEEVNKLTKKKYKKYLKGIPNGFTITNYAVFPIESLIEIINNRLEKIK